MQAYSQVELAGATDVLLDRAQALTAEYGGRAYATLEGCWPTLPSTWCST